MNYLSSFLTDVGGGAESKKKRQYDLVVWGATGFTGRLVCSHLAAHAPSNVRWAVGGRRASALHDLVDGLGHAQNAPCGYVEGDALDESACRLVAMSTRLVLSCSGPFSRVGNELVDACARAGTHYCDITGEAVPFVRGSIVRNDTIAKETGAVVVHCCGFDSVPSDVLSTLAVELLEEEQCTRCVVAADLKRTVGTASGGTLASVGAIISHLSKAPSDLRWSLDSSALTGSASRPYRVLLEENEAPVLPGYDSLLGSWHCGFVMATVNTKIVKRTRSLTGRDFSYSEVLATGRGLSGLVLALVIGSVTAAGSMMMLLPPTRWLVALLAPPGSGPSSEARRAGRWRFDVAALGARGSVVRGAVEAVGQDPGYASTAVIVAETALCVLEERGGKGGVQTPVTACGARRLADKLRKFGIVFDVSLSKPKRSRSRKWCTKTGVCFLVCAMVLSTALFVRSTEIISHCRMLPAPLAVGIAFLVATGVVFSKKPKATTSLVILGLFALCDGPLLWRFKGDLTGRTYLVTGANSGLGYSTAKALSKSGGTVVLACRSAARCLEAQRSLGGKTLLLNENLDLGDLRSVEKYAAAVKRKLSRLDGLVLNAGFAAAPGDGLPELTKQNLEMSFGTMAVGHSLLADRLRGLVSRRSGRVVWVASEAHHFASPFDATLYENEGEGDLRGEVCTKHTPLDSKFVGLAGAISTDWFARMLFGQGFGCAYMRAKKANVLLAMANGDTTAAPGFVLTPIFYKRSSAKDGFIIRLLQLPMNFMTLLMRSSDVGIAPILRATLDDSTRGKMVDSMARPWSYESSCWATGGCDGKEAIRLEEVVAKKYYANTTPKEKRTPEGGAREQFEAFVKFAKIAFVITVLAMGSIGLLMRSTGASPGKSLNLLNTFLEHPLTRPFADLTTWLTVALVYLLLTPIAILVALRRFLDAATCGKAVPSADKAVFISGCDTGFGRALAIDLAQAGFTVFAGCLGESKLAENGIISLKCDVTSDEDVAAAVLTVEAWLSGEGRQLITVVANAGVGTGGYADWLAISDFKRDMEVNYFGVVRVAKAFVPLLRQGSRIVIVGSMSSKLPVGLLASYASSKHAVSCFASCLRMELRLWGVHVCTVLPSFHRTPLLATGVMDMDRVYNNNLKYGSECFESTKATARKFMNDFAWDPLRVVEALKEAATSTAPPPRELVVGSDARLMLTVLHRLPPAIYEPLIARMTCDAPTLPAAAPNAL